MLKKTLIYRRAVFVKTGQLNELGGYKPRTSGRRTCKFYILKSFRVFYMSFFYFFSIYKSANAFFLLRFLGYPVPFEAYTCVHRHIHIHTRAHFIATYTIDCASHWETCIHWIYLSNLSCIFLNSTDHWVFVLSNSFTSTSVSHFLMMYFGCSGHLKWQCINNNEFLKVYSNIEIYSSLSTHISSRFLLYFFSSHLCQFFFSFPVNHYIKRINFQSSC